MSVGVAVLFLAVVAWWIAIPPSHDRNWRPEVAVMPRAVIDGDRVHLTGVRNFDYRSRNDFTVRHEERQVQLSHLIALDFYVSYFMEGPVGHTFVSFIFDNAPPLSISIETRPEVGEGSSPPLAPAFITPTPAAATSLLRPIPRGMVCQSGPSMKRIRNRRRSGTGSLIAIYPRTQRKT